MNSALPSRRRRGSEIVELAVSLPVVLMLVFTGFEYGWAVLKLVQLDHAARIGARVAALADADGTSVTARVNESLQDFGITGATVTLSPADPASVDTGSTISVQVEVPYGQIRLLGLSRLMPLPASLKGKASMVKEPQA